MDKMSEGCQVYVFRARVSPLHPLQVLDVPAGQQDVLPAEELLRHPGGQGQGLPERARRLPHLGHPHLTGTLELFSICDMYDTCFL